MSNKLLRGSKDIRQIYDKQWTVTVIDQVDISALLQGFISCLPSQPIVNAFVSPSGNIFVFTGMLDLCKNDDQLAVRQLIYICMYSFQEKAHTFKVNEYCAKKGYHLQRWFWAMKWLTQCLAILRNSSLVPPSFRLRALPTTCVLTPSSSSPSSFCLSHLHFSGLLSQTMVWPLSQTGSSKRYLSTIIVLIPCPKVKIGNCTN